MDRMTARLEQDVGQLREDVRRLHDMAVTSKARLDAHEDGCVEASKRTQEKIDGVDRKAERIEGKLDEVRSDLREDRERDDGQRRERQAIVDAALDERQARVDARLRAMEGWNRRVAVAVVVAAIAIVGAIMGTAAKPFVAPAVEAVRSLR